MDHYVLCDMYTLGLIVHTLYINNTVHDMLIYVTYTVDTSEHDTIIL